MHKRPGLRTCLRANLCHTVTQREYELIRSIIDAGELSDTLCVCSLSKTSSPFEQRAAGFDHDYLSLISNRTPANWTGSMFNSPRTRCIFNCGHSFFLFYFLHYIAVLYFCSRFLMHTCSRVLAYYKSRQINWSYSSCDNCLYNYRHSPDTMHR